MKDVDEEPSLFAEEPPLARAATPAKSAHQPLAARMRRRLIEKSNSTSVAG